MQPLLVSYADLADGMEEKASLIVKIVRASATGTKRRKEGGKQRKTERKKKIERRVRA